MNFINKIKNNNILLVIFVVFIVEVITTILRFIKYISYYNRNVCNYFHYSLDGYREKMTDKSFSALFKISYDFPEYYDNAAIGFMIDKGYAGFAMVFSILFLTFSFTCLYCGKNGCSMCFYIFTSIFCTVCNSICLKGKGLIPTFSLALTSVPKEDIDDEVLNMEVAGKTLKDQLDYYYYGRKTWLKIYSVIIFLGSIIQIALVIYNNKNNNEPTNKKDFIKTSDINITTSRQDLINSEKN